jgi:hypothetical protein
MRETIDRLLRDVTLTSLALAIALGWSLVRVAQGVSDTVTNLLTHRSSSDLLDLTGGQPLTWVVGHRVLSLYSLVSGVVELAVVFAVALLVLRYSRRRDAAR